VVRYAVDTSLTPKGGRNSTSREGIPNHLHGCFTIKRYPTCHLLPYQTYTAKAVDCNACVLSDQCLRGPIKPNDGRGRQVTRFEAKPKDNTHPSERMRQAIDSPRGRQLYSQRFGTVEPVFGNIRHNKRMTRLNHRGLAKVNTQWNLYCMVHNIEKLAKTGLGQTRRR